jgi:hypothetical protein
MAHSATLQGDEEGNAADWGAHVTGDEYARAPALSA